MPEITYVKGGTDTDSSASGGTSSAPRRAAPPPGRRDAAARRLGGSPRGGSVSGGRVREKEKRLIFKAERKRSPASAGEMFSETYDI